MDAMVDSYGFRFLDAVAPDLLTLHGLGHECRLSDYDWHNENRQANLWLFQYTLEGKGRLRLGGKEYALPPETGFLMRLPNDSRYWLDSGGWRLIWIIVGGEWADRYLTQVLEHYEAVVTLSVHSPAIEALHQAYQKARTGQINTANDAQEVAFRFICRLHESLSKPAQRAQSPVKQALAIIEAEHATLESAGEIARRLHLSQEHLSRLFTAQTGRTLIQSLTHARMRHAAQLLLNSDLTLEAIAVQCGYSNANYFGKAFKRAVGLAPAAFRQNAHAQGYCEVLL